MAWFETGGGVGKVLEETVLWTNPSPTTNFASNTVTLSDSLSNYKYIKAYFRLSTQISTEGECMVAIEKFDDYNDSISTPRLGLIGVVSDAAYARPVKYVSDTEVLLGSCFNMAATTLKNGYTIPLKISGLKYVDGSVDYTLKHYTTNITFNDNTTYHFIANGRFVSCSLTRPSVTTAPVLQFFLKDSQGNYNPISINRTTNTSIDIGTSETDELTKGDIYVKKNSGTNFTTSTIDIRYL